MMDRSVTFEDDNFPSQKKVEDWPYNNSCQTCCQRNKSLIEKFETLYKEHNLNCINDWMKACTCKEQQEQMQNEYKILAKVGFDKKDKKVCDFCRAREILSQDCVCKPSAKQTVNQLKAAE